MTRCSFFLCFSLLSSLLLSACRGGGSETNMYVPAGSSDWPLFVYPQPGDPHVDITQSIKWTPADNARAYELQIGTTLGGNDVFDSGVITATSIAMPSLPGSVVLYARVRAILNGWGDASPAGHWSRGSYTSFRIDGQTPASVFTNVTAGGTLPAGAPLEWSTSPLALGYRVVVTGARLASSATDAQAGSAGDLSETGDTGAIHTTHVFIDATTNATVTATLYTIYVTHSVSTQVEFTAVGGVPSFAEEYEVGKKLTSEVRTMADRDNQPYGGTLLAKVANEAGLSSASCSQFMLALLQLIEESRVGLTVRPLDIDLQANGYDTHTLVEVFDATANRWITLDPTFGLVTLRSDGTPATSAEVSMAVRAQNWAALKFEFLTPAGSFYANDYYIDYPLLFMNVESADGTDAIQTAPVSLAAYYDSLPLPISNAQGSYSLKCASGYTSATARVNGIAQTFPCGGSDQLTPSFSADDIQAIDASAGVAWRLRRFTF